MEERPKMRIDGTTQIDGREIVQVSVPIWMYVPEKVMWNTNWIEASEIALDSVVAPTFAEIKAGGGWVHSERAKKSEKPRTTHSTGFAIELGEFRDEDGAERWVQRLATIGVPAYTEPRGKANGTTVLLLRGGPFRTRLDADAAIAKIRAAGLGKQSADEAGVASRKNQPD
jgi:hypothetical protein